ncbi:hypothetical protein RFI_39251, partial [Reticulomyxa filosa]
ATSNLNGLSNEIYNMLKEENEFKILKEMCLHILCNILKYPKRIKYHQINKQALYNNLLSKCHTLGVNFKQMFEKMENQLQYYGFKKGNNDNWYYQYDNIQLLHLWNYYKYWINQQPIYKTRHWIIERVCMLWNGKWKDYEC